MLLRHVERCARGSTSGHAIYSHSGVHRDHVGLRAGAPQRRHAKRSTEFNKIRVKSSVDRNGGDVLSMRELYDEARMLLPTLDQSNRRARESDAPAIESEKKWQDADSEQREIRNRVSQGIGELENACKEVLNVPSSSYKNGTLTRDPTHDMILHHTNFRMQQFLKHQETSRKEVKLWRVFEGVVSMHAFDVLPGGHLGNQLACCSIDDEPYLVACIAVAMDPLVDVINAPKSLMLHWSVSDHEGGAWYNNIPMGWHTYPGISNPHGTKAWQTNLAHYNPVLSIESREEDITQISVHSIIVQIPMAGHFLEERGGGIKFILKRTDNCDDLWIKSNHHHQDFYLSLDEAISYLNPSPIRRDQDDLNAVPGSVEENADIEEEASMKFLWARALAEEIIQSQSFENIPETYLPQYLWVDKIVTWDEITDYDMNAGSSLSQYVMELRLLLDLIWLESSIQGSTYMEQKDLFFLKTECSKLEADIQALDAAEMKSRAIQLEKDRLWEEREIAIKEASRVHGEVKSRVENLRRNILAKAGRDTEVTLDDLKALCSRLVLGSDGQEKGAGMFKNWFGGSNVPMKHVFVSENIEKVEGMDAHIVTQVYFEGEEAVVNAAMEMHGESGDETELLTNESKHSFPFDTILVSIAFGEAFPDKLSTSHLSLHYGLISQRNGTWIPAPESTQVAIQREKATENDTIQFEAFKIKHKNGKTIFMDPIVRGLCLRFPVEELRLKKVLGVEFVLKSGKETWVRKEGGGNNFFIHIPMIKE